MNTVDDLEDECKGFANLLDRVTNMMVHGLTGDNIAASLNVDIGTVRLLVAAAAYRERYNA
jgi:orotate phosphoribosyltransferase-like protein